MSTEENRPQESAEPAEQADDRFSAFDEPVRPDEKKPAKRKISSRTRTLLIACVGVVLLVGILLLVLWLPQNEEAGSSGDPTESSVTYPVYDHKSDNAEEQVVQSVRVQQTGEEYTLQYNKEQKLYQLVGYEDLTLSDSDTTTMAECAAVMNATGKVNTVTSLADFGLDDPDATVTVTYSDGSTVSFKIGKITPSGDGYYVMLADGEDVYICSESSVSSFLRTAASYVNTILMTAPAVKEDDSDGTATLKSLTVTGTAHPEKLSIRRITSEDQDEFSYFTYVITEPYYRGIQDAIGTTLASYTSMIASSAVVLHPTAADRTKYGFDKPHTVADVTLAVQTASTPEGQEDPVIAFYNNTPYKFTVGGTDADGNYYVMVDGTNAIFLVSTSTISPIVERQYANTVNSLLFIRDIQTISRMDITAEGLQHSFILTHNKDEEDSDKSLTVTENGKTLSTPDFRTLYQLAMSLARYGTADAAPSGDPAMTLALYNQDGSLFLKADVFATSASVYTVRTSEGEIFSTKASDVTNVITQTKNYLDGKTVLNPM